ncbi:MAG: hypothetical protein EOM83_14590 [Clostridia bacterium]|nr:hypothetical protein [Clostridia bacterium]
MKPASISQLKQALRSRSPEELTELCLRMARFKKENKEMLSYLIFDADDELAFIISVKQEMDRQFAEINTSSIYFIKKSIRKILRIAQKFIRYSGQKQTEVELLLHFCRKVQPFVGAMKHSTALTNLYLRQVNKIEKTLSTLHEDLQYDYGEELRTVQGSLKT